MMSKKMEFQKIFVWFWKLSLIWYNVTHRLIFHRIFESYSSLRAFRHDFWHPRDISMVFEQNLHWKFAPLNVTIHQSYCCHCTAWYLPLIFWINPKWTSYTNHPRTHLWKIIKNPQLISLNIIIHLIPLLKNYFIDSHYIP